MKKFLIHIKNTAEYLMACAIALIFAIYCSGRVGYFLLTVLLLAPVFSVLITYIASRSVRISAKISADICDKGSETELILTMKKPFKLFVLPMVKYECHVPPSFMRLPAGTTHGWSSGISDEHRIRLKAVYAGGALISAGRALLTDFLCLTSFEAKYNEAESFTVGVIPQPRAVPNDSERLKDAMEGADLYGDSEETIEESTNSFGGFPGYEHREYRDGDPIKRINYKLSARRDELFVRLDERQVLGNVELTLDPHVPPQIKEGEAAPWWETQIEETLGLCETLLLKQFTVSLSFYKNEKWETRILRQAGEGAALAKEVAFCRYIL